MDIDLLAHFYYSFESKIYDKSFKDHIKRRLILIELAWNKKILIHRKLNSCFDFLIHVYFSASLDVCTHKLSNRCVKILSLLIRSSSFYAKYCILTTISNYKRHKYCLYLISIFLYSIVPKFPMMGRS
ncbi:hypothetical protein HZS_6863 [Henneguya salminicola]|nr:hypothetical protein HZS_6863 [Henneguya salminicola]